MVARKIGVKDGKKKDGTCRWRTYYYWDSYQTKEEAINMANKIIDERKKSGIKVRSWISVEEEGRIYPIQVFRLYFDRRMKLL